MAIEVNYQRGGEIVLSTEQEVEALLGRIRDEAEPPAVMAYVSVQGGTYGQLLQIGVHGDRGWMSYGKGPDAWWSKGSDSDGDAFSYFQRTHTVEVPASAEIPYEAVSAGVREFLRTGGERPTNVEWVEDA